MAFPTITKFCLTNASAERRQKTTIILITPSRLRLSRSVACVMLISTVKVS